MEKAPENNNETNINDGGGVHDENSTVTLKVRASALHSKNEKARQYWAAVHALILAAVEASNEEEEEQDDALNPEVTLEDGEVKVEAEEGEVEQGVSKDESQEATREMINQSSRSSSPSVDQSDSAEEDKVIEVSFANGYLIDPSGEWTEFMHGMDSPLTKAIEYVKDLDRTVLGTDVKVTDLMKKQGGKRKLNGCFNCGSTDHTVAQCPEPMDRRRIAEARAEHERSGARYYESDKGNTLAQKYPDVKSGVLSASLRAALGLRENDEDPFVRIRQRLGPPPTCSEEPVYKSTIAEEPILSIVNDATTTPESITPSPSLSEAKSPSPAEADPSLPYPTCKEQGSDIWRKRLLPVCTCGTEERCLRADPIVPPARFSSEPPKASPPPLLISTRSEFGDSGRRSRNRSPRRSNNEFKRDERQISSSSRADTDYSRPSKRFRSRERDDRRYSEGSHFGRREADRRDDYYQNNYTPPVAYVPPSPVSSYAGYPPQQPQVYMNSFPSPALDEPGAGPRLISYSQGGFGGGQQLPQQQQHPYQASPPYMGGYPSEPPPSGQSMPPPMAYPLQPPSQGTTPTYPAQGAQQSRWQSGRPPVYYG